MNQLDLIMICLAILLAGGLNAIVLRRIEALLERIADKETKP